MRRNPRFIVKIDSIRRVTMKFERFFSETAKKAKASAIRELLKLVSKPEIISLAGGLPDPATFPKEQIKKISSEVIDKYGDKALQYGITEGIPELREWLGKNFAGKDVSLDNVIITSASQQGLDLIGNVFIDPGDPIIVELPTYLGGISAFKMYDARFIGVKLDDDGLIIDELKDKIISLKKEGKKPKFLYTVSNFHNPAGVTLSLERRKEILDIAKENDFLIIEDDPYHFINFKGEDVPSIYSLDTDDRVILLGTFSKILTPGFRLGWIFGPEEILHKIVQLKQAKDLCTNTFVQYIAYEYANTGAMEEHFDLIVKIYKEKRDVMLSALDKYFPKEVKWTKPEGGFFVFAYLPEYIDADKMFYDAIEENVAYVIGSAFYPDGSGKNTMRLSFCYPSKEQIEEGIKRLGSVIRKKIK